MNKKSPKSLSAFTCEVSGKGRDSFSQRMGLWSVKMLREGEGRGNKGQAKVRDSDHLRTLGVALKNDTAFLSPMEIRSCPAPGVGTAVGGIREGSFL